MGFETCGPNEAMVVSGCGHDSPCMIPGGRVWVWPVIQDSFYQTDGYDAGVYQLPLTRLNLTKTYKSESNEFL